MKVFAIQNTQTNTYPPQFKQNNSQGKTFTRPMAIKDTVAFGMPKVHIKTADEGALRRRLAEIAKKLENDGMALDKRNALRRESVEIETRLEELEPPSRPVVDEDADEYESEGDRILRHRIDDMSSDGYKVS